MAVDNEVEAMTRVSEALSKIEDEAAKRRVLNWARDRFLPNGGGPNRNGESAGAQGDVDSTIDVLGLPQKASRWLRQVGLTLEQIDQVYHIDGKEVSVIATDIPGRSASGRVLNCYLLEGVAALLGSGEPAVSDAAGRARCDSAGCLDVSNHSRRVGTFGNKITGDSRRGWTVTGPGLSAAAALIKEMATA